MQLIFVNSEHNIDFSIQELIDFAHHKFGKDINLEKINVSVCQEELQCDENEIVIRIEKED